MSNKKLFASQSSSAVKILPTDTVNAAGGKAYSLTAKAALAQYAMTGCFNGTYYASAEDQLAKTLELAKGCDPVFLAKLAIYSRQEGLMKDMPALLAAVLATKDTVLLQKVFSQVIDSPKMVRNFVQIIRSGVTGRKSLGTRPKKLVQGYFESLTDEQLFKADIGNSPSLPDMIKMVRPKPGDAKRNALYAYLLDKDYNVSDLLPLAKAYEDFKKTPAGEIPNVPFQMLDCLPLTDSQWKQLAENMSWTQTRMNLNTLLRHGVLKDAGMVKMVVERLTNIELIKKAKVFPYQIFAAYKNVSAEMPVAITNALQKAAEIATENIPAIDGKVYVMVDVSGSMQSPATGSRGSATSKVSCVDVAALVAASILRKNPDAEVIAFSDDIVPCKLNPLDSIVTNAQKLASLPSGGTNCSAPLRYLNTRKAPGDVVIYVSDNQSWMDSTYNYSGTQTMKEWKKFKARNPKAKLICNDIAPYGDSQAVGKDVLNVGGFSDQVFSVVSRFVESSSDPEFWVKTIEATKL